MSMQDDRRAEGLIPAERVTGIIPAAHVPGSVPALPRRKRWWWLALAAVVLVLALAANAWRKNRDFEGAQRAFREDRLKDAQKQIQRYLKARPDNAAAHLLAARIDRLLNFYAGAEKHLHECTRLGGINADIQVENYLLRAMNGDFPAVERDLRQLLADNDPRSDLIVETLVHCHIGVLRFNSAMDHLQWWLKKEPDNIRALDLRAFVWERLENREQAIVDYGRVLQLAPENRHARLALVEILLVQKNIQEAAEQLNILRQYPDSLPGELLALARLQILQGNTEEARETLDALLAKKPDDAEGLYELGMLMLTKDPVQAEGYFKKALTGHETFMQARFQLYNLLFRLGRKQEAEAEKTQYLALQKDLERLPQILLEADRLANPDLLADAAGILLRGNDNQGTQLLYRALHLDPNHKRSHLMLADHFEKTKQPEKAARHRKLAGAK
jgi:tetratricopeptide (TPR) repeat protein